mmetsp:Transcript_2962/g.8480  ORF Transcript_2962/g.8480 Transcript_2962/m.8480 type:complete len:312 (-) Transcript_2962:221-1156(-)
MEPRRVRKTEIPRLWGLSPSGLPDHHSYLYYSNLHDDLYHPLASRFRKVAGNTLIGQGKVSLLVMHAGQPSAGRREGSGSPRQKREVPEPDMDTTGKPRSLSFALSMASSGIQSKAGCSRSLTNLSGPSSASRWSRRRLSGSVVDRLSRSSALKTAGVDSPTSGFTMYMDVGRSAGFGSRISPRPVQYAVPWEKKKVASEPSCLDQSSRSSGEPGLPQSSFRPYRVVAALPLPPPSPAWAGTVLVRRILKKRLTPDLMRNTSTARRTRFVLSVGTPSMSHSKISSVAVSGRREMDTSSLREIAWKSEAKSW